MARRRGSTRVLAALLAMAALVAQRPASAKVHHSNVDVDDRKLIPMAEAFAFADGKRGHLDITLSSISIFMHHDDDRKLLDYNNFGFFLSAVEAEADATLEADLATDTCVLSNASLVTFNDTGIQQVIERSVDSYTYKFEIENGGYYYLYFANCAPIDTPVSFEATIELYNDNGAGVRNYLSVGETQLEAVYWTMFALFTILTGVWAWFCWQHKQHAHRIHLLMGLLCAFKALTVMSQAGMYHVIERTGTPDGWNIAYYVFTFFRGVLFFTVVVLIGTGWSYMKPFLGDREKRILMIVIPLQVFANIAIVVTDEESVSLKDWFTWRDLFHLVDIILCCLVLFPIVWSIKHLREAAGVDGKAARNLEKLTLFRQFYVTVVVYIYFTRIVVYLLQSTLPYQYVWLSDGAEQLATLAFYVWTAVKFRPADSNPYLKLEQSEIELG